MWYYTLNGQQAGPVSQAELAQMLNGSLPSDTLVWKEGMADWLPAQDVDAFRNIEATPPSQTNGSNPYAAPNSIVDENIKLSGTDEIPATPIPLDIGFCISKSWKTTIACFGAIFLTWFVYILITSIVGGVLSTIGTAIDGPVAVAPITEGMTQQAPFLPSHNQSINQQTGTGAIIAGILNNIFTMFLGLGLTLIGLNLLRGKDTNLGQLFGQSGTKLFRLIGASILYGLMVGLGLVFFIVPGIYLGMRFMFYQTVIVDKDLGVIDSLKYSSSLTRDNKWRLFFLFIINCFIVLAGALALIVGLIWALPVAWLTLLVAYLYLHDGERSLAA
ncbi:MAG: GYF domain-containing protein [Rubritalea sp.]|uniref:GYF domain-containing protein n=1 Tax=Rubritalea sp. TaxID=2109375 RepID=UPI00324252C1